MTCYSATYVIVGGGIAGVSCAEMLMNITGEDSQESILVISPSPMVKNVTNVSSVTKLLTAFDVEEIEAGALESKSGGRIRVLRAEVNKTDSDLKELHLTDGTGVVKYEKVCLCHGARPKLLVEDPHVLGIRDTESVLEFQRRLSSSSSGNTSGTGTGNNKGTGTKGTGARRLVLIGNGGIATELVHELSGVEIVWAIKDDSISKAFVDAGAGEFFFKELNKSKPSEASSPSKRTSSTTTTTTRGSALGPDWHTGLDVRGCLQELERTCGRRVRVEYQVEVNRILSREEFKKASLRETKELFCDNEEDEKDIDWNIYVELSNGIVVGCDLIVSATGVVPNGDLIPITPTNASLSSTNSTAIAVNDNMRTSVPHVFAAGDVCEAEWRPRAKHWFQMRLWTQARQMGMYAAQCMKADYDGESKDLDFCFEMFTHCTKFFGFKVILLGLFNAQGLQEGKGMDRIGDSSTNQKPPESSKESVGGISETLENLSELKGNRETQGGTSETTRASLETQGGTESPQETQGGTSETSKTSLGIQVGPESPQKTQGGTSEIQGGIESPQEPKLELLLRTTPGSEYIKVVLEDGRMQGCVLIGETDLEETFENLILNQMDLSQFGEGLLDPDVDIEDYFD